MIKEIKGERRDRVSFFIQFVLLFGATILASMLLTYLFRSAARRFRWTDRPSEAKVHSKETPTMGGVAIFLAYWGAFFIGVPDNVRPGFAPIIFLSSMIILVTGIIDDYYDLKPWQKMIGILTAANILYFYSGIKIDSLTLSYFGTIEFREAGYLVMMLWIVVITNAVNLMDGLDGLATGTSIISLSTMGLVSYFFTSHMGVSAVVMIFLLVASLLGFLPFNFYPASIFLGDTGSLFVGFMIAVLSLFGLKHATFVSLLIPVAILGVPLTDTIAAVLRRTLHKRSISAKDKSHLHHRLLRLGFTHRQTVLVIYALAIIFSLTAILFPISSFWGTVVLGAGLIYGVVLFIASFNLLDSDRSRLRRTLYRLLREKDDKKK